MDKRYKSEIEQVKELGERIGYGNMMSIASGLWALMLEKQYGITSGAFVPTVTGMMKKIDAKRAELERARRKEMFREAGF